MTGAQVSYLKWLCEQLDESGDFGPSLTNAGAPKRIDAIKSKLDQKRQMTPSATAL